MTTAKGSRQKQLPSKAGHHPNHDDERTPLRKRSILHKRSINNREKGILNGNPKWIVLFLCCMVMAALYYLLAMPAALHRQLYSIMPTENFETNFNLLFTVSYFPNMVLPMFGGAVVDKHGEALCLVLFCVVILIGQVLTAFGVASASWNAMLAGRIIFGLGAQNLMVANAALISKWFTGLEGVALGLSNVCSYAGVIFTNIASPRVANMKGPPFAFWIGVLVEIGAIILGLVILPIDRSKKKASISKVVLMCSPMYSPAAYYKTTERFKPTIMSRGDTETTSPSDNSSSGKTSKNGTTTVSTTSRSRTVSFDRSALLDNESHDGTTTVYSLPNFRHFKPTFWLLCLSFLLIYGIVWSFTNVSSALLLERDFFMQTPADCQPRFPHQCTSGTLASPGGNPSVDSQHNECPGENVAPAIPQSLNVFEGDYDDVMISWDESKYVFKSLHHSDIDCNDPFWSEGCTEEYCQEQASATEKAGVYMSIPYFFTVALTFHLGLLVDRTGWRTEMICVGSALLIVAHALLAYRTTSPPIVPLIGQGLGYTICVAALWPSVPFTVDEDMVGIAFGIMMCVQNVGLALMPLAVAFLFHRGDGHYLPSVELFFAGCAILALIVGITLMIADKKTGSILDTPKSERRSSDRAATDDESDDEMLMKLERANSDAMVMFGGRGKFGVM